MKVKALTMSKRSMRRVRIMIHKRMMVKMMTIICMENMMKRLTMDTKTQAKMRVKRKATIMRINRKSMNKKIINHIMGMNNLNNKMNKKTKKSKKKMNSTKNMEKRNKIISLMI
jgi:hypothetical protein